MDIDFQHISFVLRPDDEHIFSPHFSAPETKEKAAAKFFASKKIEFTDRAKEQIEIVTREDQSKKFFRISVKGGGCSGFQYEFTFDNEKAADDLNYENILIDKTSADLLKGSEIDYVSELIGEQFKITNPQTKSSCGCGVSFSL